MVGDGSAGAVVVPDEGGQGEDSLQGADDDPGRGVFAMASEFSWPLTVGQVAFLDAIVQRGDEAAL